MGRGRGARAFWIPAYAGMTVIVGGAVRGGAVAAVGGVIGDGIPACAGMTVIAVGAVGRGRDARAFWIPAYAGMTVIVGGAVRRMAVALIGGAVGGGIPAYAGMTVVMQRSL